MHAHNASKRRGEVRVHEEAANEVGHCTCGVGGDMREGLHKERVTKRAARSVERGVSMTVDGQGSEKKCRGMIGATPGSSRVAAS